MVRQRRLRLPVLSEVPGHIPHGVTRRHYNLYAYDNEKCEALDRWADIVDAIVKGAMTEDNVIPFRAGAA